MEKNQEVIERTPWGEVFTAILNIGKNIKKKNLILSKAKLDKMAEGSSKRTDKIMAEGDEEINEDEKTPFIQNVNESFSESIKCRKKPNAFDSEKEKRLNAIATKGVVQLFNAVRQHQITLENKLKEAGPSDRKRSKILSNVSEHTINSLENKKRKNNDNSEEKPTKWKVLKDDYFKKPDFKDWKIKKNSKYVDINENDSEDD